MNRKPIKDTTLQEHLATLSPDVRDVFLLEHETIRGTVINGTEMVNQMRVNHDLGILETYTLGQAYLAGAILASTVKGNDRVQLTIECGGPIKGLSVEAWASGGIRGYLQENPIEITAPLESFDLSDFFGPGFLTVTKLLEDKKQPFHSQIMIEYGSIAKDLANYFVTSEQTPTMVSISIQFDKEGRVKGAGALFLQRLPNATHEDMDRVVAATEGLPSLGAYLAEGKSGTEYIEEYLGDLNTRFLEKLPVGFSCPCDRKAFSQYLSSLPEKEKEAIMQEGPFPLHLHCFNCGTQYQFEYEELNDILRTATR